MSPEDRRAKQGPLTATAAHLKLTAETGRVDRSSLALAADPVVARRLRDPRPAPSSLLGLGRDDGAILAINPASLRCWAYFLPLVDEDFFSPDRPFWAIFASEDFG